MLSEEEKKAIEFMKFYKKHCLKKELENMKNYKTVNDGEFVSTNIETILNLIEKQQAQIEKKDNIIYEMAKAIYRMDTVSEYGFNKEEIIEYFTKK